MKKTFTKKIPFHFYHLYHLIDDLSCWNFDDVPQIADTLKSLKLQLIDYLEGDIDFKNYQSTDFYVCVQYELKDPETEF